MAFVATCADGASIPLVQKGGEASFCADKRFGSFFWQEVSLNQKTARWLYYCTSPSESDWFPFGQDYAYAVVARTKGRVVVFALAAGGHNYRCESKATVDNTTPLPLNQELCDGFAVVARGETVKVTQSGQTLQLIALAPW
jgi:hypothetical protein